MDEKRWLFRFNELTQQKFLSVGKKCANLGEMTHVGLPVPPGFALSVDAYTLFLHKTGLYQEITEYLKQYNLFSPLNYSEYQKISLALRKLIDSRQMPEDMAETIRIYYREVEEQSGIEDVPVAIRSSGPVSMPGQFETYLNIRGVEDVIQKIIHCWSSTFTTQAIAYRIQKSTQQSFIRPSLGTSLGGPEPKIDITSPIGVGVLKMVNAKSSGVAFTVHPTSGDRNKIVVEGNWGLGESVVGGDISPDRFVIDKQTMHIDPTINCKTKRVVYSSKGTTEEEVPLELQNNPCLSREELQRIIRFALQLEQYFGAPQDVEWAVDQDLSSEDNLLLLQTRPVSNVVEHKKLSAENIADLFISKVFKRF
ncbi:MAG: PEP/pyruvate-binding domain-containing protein [Bacillota bacterium]|nr:PEP/pyruvate-binding domain-containing protein [Bacillota bacterium]